MPDPGGASSAPSPGAGPPGVDRRARRNAWWLVIALLPIAAIVQTGFVSCACAAGSVKGNAILAADAAILLRASIALVMEDRSGGWILYLLLYALLVPATLWAAELSGWH